MKRFLAVVFSLWLLITPVSSWAIEKPDILEIVSISGEIRDSSGGRLKDQIDKINDNQRVKAVLLEVDSPGGTVHGSDGLYRELAKIKVPVVAWCGDVCASGAYYVMMAPSVKFIAMGDVTITGSIGVVMHNLRYNRLLEWAKIDSETYKSGELKDAGNPERAVTEAERAYLQGIINRLADRFYSIVLKARPGMKTVPTTGEIYFGDQAVKLGLADAVMSRDDAIKKAKELSGSKNIFTREELDKMSREAQGDPAKYSAPDIMKSARSEFGDLPWLIEMLKEIHDGQSVQFLYLMPYRF